MIRPCLIRIHEEFWLNLSSVATFVVEYGIEQPVLKDEIRVLLDAGTLGRPLQTDDYVSGIAHDQISIFYESGKGLVFKRGVDINDADFDRVVATLKYLEFKYDRKPAVPEIPQGT